MTWKLSKRQLARPKKKNIILLIYLRLLNLIKNGAILEHRLEGWLIFHSLLLKKMFQIIYYTSLWYRNGYTYRAQIDTQESIFGSPHWNLEIPFPPNQNIQSDCSIRGRWWNDNCDKETLGFICVLFPWEDIPNSSPQKATRTALTRL